MRLDVVVDGVAGVGADILLALLVRSFGSSGGDEKRQAHPSGVGVARGGGTTTRHAGEGRSMLLLRSMLVALLVVVMVVLLLLWPSAAARLLLLAVGAGVREQLPKLFVFAVIDRGEKERESRASSIKVQMKKEVAVVHINKNNSRT